MSVNAISSYSPTAVYSYFKSSISTSQLQTLLEKYGITSSGNQDEDLRKLYAAMPESSIKEIIKAQFPQVVEEKPKQQVQDASASSNASIPWANLMSQVGLSASGDLQTDYLSFSAQVSKMESSAAATGQNKANIDQLMAQAAVVFGMPVGASQTASVARPDEASSSQNTGAEIISNLNRMRLKL